MESCCAEQKYVKRYYKEGLGAPQAIATEEEEGEEENAEYHKRKFISKNISLSF